MLTAAELIIWALAQFGYRGPVYPIYYAESPQTLDGIWAWAHPNVIPHDCVIGAVSEDRFAHSEYGHWFAMHEVGHCLGLDHTDDGNSYMGGGWTITRQNWLDLMEWRLDFPYRVAVPGLAR